MIRVWRIPPGSKAFWDTELKQFAVGDRLDRLEWHHWTWGGSYMPERWMLECHGVEITDAEVDPGL